MIQEETIKVTKEAQKDTNQTLQETTPPNLDISKSQIDSSIYASRVIEQIVEDLSIMLVTWNLRGAIPPQNMVNSLFSSQKLQKMDIVVIGTQECQRSLFQSFFNQSKQTWELSISEALHTQKFINLRSNVLQGLHLIVFCRQSCFKEIKNIATHSVKTGLGGFMGNKGAISIQFDYKQHSLVFINVHLAAMHDQTQERNESLIYIMDSLTLKSDAKQVSFIFGDMNYRIDVPQSQCRQFNKKSLKSLSSFYVDKDQMRKQEDLQPFFQKYDEGLINFPPTYKMSLSKNQYTEQRIPGWTDRIFYKKDDKIELNNYSSDHEIFGSDHRPVIGTFKIKIQETMKVKKRKRKAAKSESNCLIF